MRYSHDEMVLIVYKDGLILRQMEMKSSHIPMVLIFYKVGNRLVMLTWFYSRTKEDER